MRPAGRQAGTLAQTPRARALCQESYLRAQEASPRQLCKQVLLETAITNRTTDRVKQGSLPCLSLKGHLRGSHPLGRRMAIPDHRAATG